MRTYRFTCKAASYSSPLGHFVRGVSVDIDEDDPRVPMFRATKAFDETAMEGGALAEAAPVPQPVEERTERQDRPAPARTSLDALGDNRLAAILSDGGVESIEDILEMGEDGLIHIHGIGDVTAKKIMSLASLARADRVRTPVRKDNNKK